MVNLDLKIMLVVMLLRFRLPQEWESSGTNDQQQVFTAYGLVELIRLETTSSGVTVTGKLYYTLITMPPLEIFQTQLLIMVCSLMFMVKIMDTSHMLVLGFNY